jgi:PTH2 family peptidyl-tRNA hydrolase
MQDLRLYAVLRSDIKMSNGKCIAQAGHAFTSSLLQAISQEDLRANSYAQLTPGTKITLDGGSDRDILLLKDRIEATGIPCFLVIDSGHVELPDFDGSPTITALGIGPCTRKDVRRTLSRLKLWNGIREGSS